MLGVEGPRRIQNYILTQTDGARSGSDEGLGCLVEIFYRNHRRGGHLPVSLQIENTHRIDICFAGIIIRRGESPAQVRPCQAHLID